MAAPSSPLPYSLSAQNRRYYDKSMTAFSSPSLCHHTPSRQPCIIQVNRLRSFTSAIVRSRAPHVTPKLFPLRHHFTSSPELAVDPPKSPFDQASLLADAFAKPGRSIDEIKLDLDSKSVVVTLDLVSSALKDPDTDYDVAKRILNWVLETELFTSGSKIDNTSNRCDLGKICFSITKIIRGQAWGDSVEKKLRELNVEFSSDLVADVLEHLELEPNKALIFFRWIEESDLFKHDEPSYNAIARVLSKEDESDRFWKIVDEMKSAGHEMDRETYIDIFERFVERKMFKDAVSLCEFAATQKRLLQDRTLLPREVLRVLKANKNYRNLVDYSVDKCLSSVGILKECCRILLEMEKAAHVSSFASLKQGYLGSWVSLIKEHCARGNMDEATRCFKEMLDKKGPDGEYNAGHALDWLVATYCRQNRPADVYRFILDVDSSSKGFRAWNSTYKELTRKLLAKKHFNKALWVMDIMTCEHLPPDLDSFFGYLSKTGTAEQAAKFVQKITIKLPDYCPLDQR